MKKNIFEEVTERKQQVKALIDKAVSYNWIDGTQQEKMTERIDKNKITMGVIGQMKCGKSTFLNSFVFGKEILPAATTPMTAALSIITYGETQKLSVEFYSHVEWQELSNTATQSIEGKDEATTSKIKAAQELVSKSTNLGSEIETLLGSHKDDDFGKLEEYVGADGRYTPITKSVTIYLNEEYLKGVEVVDTPGFNDPVISREQRTQDFLKEADMALMIVSAGRPFDTTDRDIIFNKLFKVGIGKFLLGINKYDLQIEAESEEEMIEYVKKEYKKACIASDVSDPDILNITPILFSAQMALLGKMPLEEVLSDSDKKTHYNRTLDIFGIETQQEILTHSRIKDMDEAVKEVLLKSKMEIIANKIKNEIIAIGEKQKLDIQKEIANSKNKIKALQYDPDELEEEISNLNKAKRKISRELDYQVGEIEHELETLIRKKDSETNTFLRDEKQKLFDYIDMQKRKEVQGRIEYKLQVTVDEFKELTLNETVKRIKKIVENTFESFIEESIVTLNRYSRDFDSRAGEQQLRRLLSDTIDERYDSTQRDEDEDASSIWSDLVYGFFGGLTSFIWGPIYLLGGWRDEIKEYIEGGFSSLEKNYPEIFEHLKTNTQKALEIFQKESESLLSPIIEMLQNVQESKEDKDQAIAKAEERITTLNAALSTITTQLEEMKNRA